MASNRELRAEIQRLADLLGREIDTSRLGNASLVAMVSELQSEESGGTRTDTDPTESQREPPPESKEEAPELVTSAGFYVIAEGKAITTVCGMLRAGERVRPEHFGPDGEATMAVLLQKGCVTVAHQ